MTPADSPSRSDLASLPTVLHGNTNASDELPPETDSLPTADEHERPAAPPPSQSTDRPATPPPTPSSPESPPPPASSTSHSSTTSDSSSSRDTLAAGLGAASEDVIDAMALPVVTAVGVLANRAYYKRTGERSERWRFTQAEATALGGALGRIAANRLPEQLVEGEGGDLFVIVAVAGGYLVRNAFGISEDEMIAASAVQDPPTSDQARGPVAEQPVRPAPPVVVAPAPAADAPPPAPGGGPVLTAVDVGAV